MQQRMSALEVYCVLLLNIMRRRSLLLLPRLTDSCCSVRGHYWLTAFGWFTVTSIYYYTLLDSRRIHIIHWKPAAVAVFSVDQYIIFIILCLLFFFEYNNNNIYIILSEHARSYSNNNGGRVMIMIIINRSCFSAVVPRPCGGRRRATVAASPSS